MLVDFCKKPGGTPALLDPIIRNNMFNVMSQILMANSTECLSICPNWNNDFSCFEMLVQHSSVIFYVIVLNPPKPISIGITWLVLLALAENGQRICGSQHDLHGTEWRVNVETKRWLFLSKIRKRGILMFNVHFCWNVEQRLICCVSIEVKSGEV